MKSITQHAAPNVIAGVNFNVDRFKELFAWVNALSADSVQALLLPNSYGLVMPFDGKSALELVKEGNKIYLNRCSAITSGGGVIGIFESLTPTLELELPLDLKRTQVYTVTVEIDSRNRQAFGVTSQDLPERKLSTLPSYQLHIRMQEETLVPSHFLSIGKLVFEAEEWELTNYISPCLHIGASKVLKDRLKTYDGNLNELLKYLPSIIRQTGNYNDKATLELREFCVQIGSFLAQNAPSYHNLSIYDSPYRMIEIWNGLVSLSDFLLHRLKELPRQQFYELLEYNAHGVAGIRFNAHQFENIIGDYAKFRFEQEDILAAIEQTDKILEMIVPLLRSLSTKYQSTKKGAWEETRVKEEPITPKPPKPEESSHSTW
ncbi:MAG: hypothetical protein AAGG68_04725 [Bacteroidota bacterium]